ncbi:MAG: type II toxin-antitoxin system PemK/MazF family toxin [Spirochaetaceae bacterium]|nr:type II toxin-antitoxin system PemK/MazF family toxin [Spirochaetaceae bacterium]
MTRGDVFFVDFGIPFGSEPRYRRPVIVIQSDRENLDALNTKVVIPLTSNLVHADTPGNIFIPKHISGLSKDSVALLHQIIVVDKFRLVEKVSTICSSFLNEIESGLDYVLKD